MDKIFADSIFSIRNEEEFKQKALEVFQYQAKNIPVYKEYIDHLGLKPSHIQHIEAIPFLPIEFFKKHIISDQPSLQHQIFSSSGTTGSTTSKHYVHDLSIYESSYLKGFESFYGPIHDFCIIALLPSYLEREGSSLIYMLEDLIKKSKNVDSGFYLNEFQQIQNIIQQNEGKKKIILLGVTYALLDFAEQFPFAMHDVIIMETGGMKGKRKEMMRDEVHQILKEAFQLKQIHSEYGMTELLSQAYSTGDGRFHCPTWMKILIRDSKDPLTLLNNEQTGGINIIDLANMHSCSFIATQDLGKVYADQSFEILGRFDSADTRGCNLLIE